MEENNVTVESATQQTPAPVANAVPAQVVTKDAKILVANVKLTDKKFEYFLLSLEGEQQAVAIWPDELEQLLQQDEAIAMAMMGFENFCKLLKSSTVKYITEGEGEQVIHVIKSIKLNDALGFVPKLVEKFMMQMLG